MKLGTPLVAAALALGLSSCMTDTTPKPTPTIAAIVASDANFSTLKTALDAADLTTTFGAAGTYTVFAPDNAAFAKLGQPAIDNLLKPANKAQLTAILKYHVLDKKVLAAEVLTLGGKSVATLNGASISVAVTGTAVKLNGTSNVTKTNVEASNGVIHVIDTVLIPPSSN